jgi:O-antigen/teichoic acid export membrane protein
MINLGRPFVTSNRFEDAGRIAGTALMIVLSNATLLLILSLAFGPPALHRIGQGEIDPLLLWPLIAAIVLGAVAGSFWEGLSYLSDRFDIYVKAGIVGAIGDLIFVGIGAWSHGLRGAILAMPAAPLLLLLGYAFLLRRDGVAKAVIAKLSFSIRELPRLLTFSAMMFAAVGLTNVGLTAARTSVLLHSGAAANGNLQTATSLSAYILAFVTTGFWGHLHARAAAAGDVVEVRRELNQALERGLLISFTGCGIAAVLPDLLLPLFYSKQFAGAAPLVTAYMPGEFCFQFLTLLISYQLTVSRRRRYLAWSLGYVGLLFLVAALAIPRLGAEGYVAAHVSSAAVMVAIASFLCWSSGQVKGRTLLLAGALLALLALISAALLIEHIAPGAWMIVALLPFAVSGAVVGAQLLSGMGLFKLRSSQA